MVSYYKFEASHPNGVKCWANNEIDIHKMVKNIANHYPQYGPVTTWTIGPQIITSPKEPNMSNDLITKEQASESDMRAISQMFARAANAVVDASELGKEVKTLKTEVEKLVGDTQRLREHITWLEQENVTLRVSRDDAQNALSDAMRNIDHTKHENQLLDAKVSVTEGERDNARGEAKLWQEEAASLEKERNGLKTEVTYLKGMLTSVWHGIKDHFTEPQAPKAEPEPITEPTQAQTQVPYHESPVAGYDHGGGKGDHVTEHQF